MSVRRALLVDDDESVRDVASLALRHFGGWQVTAVDSGLRAIEVAAADHPDVVLLDVMMPGLDGLATFARLQDDPATSDIPVVLLTARILGGRPQPWDSLAVSGVIAKPFSARTLAAQVAHLVGWHHTCDRAETYGAAQR